ncbi:MAG: hypothetical protein CVV05_00185 [Gammaproteobacteria bacterium HGW-Gammaproteobacteria-1]|jgi:hypothetical protein|nr:MAG: hypothetical protein CVV05_00185 [Gammaproteobacteria bacterium HGW-Gammaproteobacteria-1]
MSGYSVHHMNTEEKRAYFERQEIVRLQKVVALRLRRERQADAHPEHSTGMSRHEWSAFRRKTAVMLARLDRLMARSEQHMSADVASELRAALMGEVSRDDERLMTALHAEGMPSVEIAEKFEVAPLVVMAACAPSAGYQHKRAGGLRVGL